MSYGIYLYMQSIAARGPGAALGVIAVVIVGLGTYFSHRCSQREPATQGAGERVMAEASKPPEARSTSRV